MVRDALDELFGPDEWRDALAEYHDDVLREIADSDIMPDGTGDGVRPWEQPVNLADVEFEAMTEYDGQQVAILPGLPDGERRLHVDVDEDTGEVFFAYTDDDGSEFLTTERQENWAFFDSMFGGRTAWQEELDYHAEDYRMTSGAHGDNVNSGDIDADDEEGIGPNDHYSF